MTQGSTLIENIFILTSTIISEKARAPAWCDRVLWRADAPIRYKSRLYTAAMQFRQSDHKPVVSVIEKL